jgi:hypothetical protein
VSLSSDKKQRPCLLADQSHYTPSPLPYQLEIVFLKKKNAELRKQFTGLPDYSFIAKKYFQYSAFSAGDASAGNIIGRKT